MGVVAVFPIIALGEQCKMEGDTEEEFIAAKHGRLSQ